MKKQIQLSAAAEGALRKLGKGIKTARIKKGITATSMAELMETTRITWFFRKFVESTEKNITIFISAF